MLAGVGVDERARSRPDVDTSQRGGQQDSGTYSGTYARRHCRHCGRRRDLLVAVAVLGDNVIAPANPR